MYIGSLKGDPEGEMKWSFALSSERIPTTLARYAVKTRGFHRSFPPLEHGALPAPRRIESEEAEFLAHDVPIERQTRGET